MRSFKYILLFLLVWAHSAAHAFNSSKESITAMGFTMGYRKSMFGSEGNMTKPCLVVYLHGGSSKGNDNMKQLQEPGTDSIANYLQASGINAIFLIPQCPADKSWGGPMNAVLKAMMDKYVEAGMVDADRVYLFGGSMGGTGTWGMLSAYPNYFAAAMPVAANPSKSDAEAVATTPAFTVMGTADVLMKVETAADFVEKLQQLADDVVMETEEGWTHEMTCIESYTTRRLDWVFSHQRGISTGIKSIAAGNEEMMPVVRRNYYLLDGRQVETPDGHRVYILKETMQNGTVRTKKVSFGK
jgi:predicted peptidase